MHIKLLNLVAFHLNIPIHKCLYKHISTLVMKEKRNKDENTDEKIVKFIISLFHFESSEVTEQFENIRNHVYLLIKSQMHSCWGLNFMRKYSVYRYFFIWVLISLHNNIVFLIF